MSPFGNDPDDDDPPPGEESDRHDVGDTESTVSKREIREELYKAQQDYNRIQQRIERRRKRYRKLLNKGSDASKHERRLIAHRARMEKFKAEMLGLQRLQAMRQLNKYTLLESKIEARNFMSEFDDNADEITTEDIDIDFGDVGDHVRQAKAEIKADMMEMKESMEMMGTGTSDLGVDEVAMREEELMDRIHEGETDPEDISFDLENDIEDRVQGEDIGEMDDMMDEPLDDFEDI